MPAAPPVMQSPHPSMPTVPGSGPGLPSGLPGQAPLPADSPLANLRDIHLPDAVNFWPPAWGWWAVTFALLMILVALLLMLYLRWKKHAPIRAALAELKQMEMDYQQQNNAAATINQIGQLLKRVSLTRHSRHSVAGLTGSEWLSYLDKTGQTNLFTQGEGKVLAQDRFNPKTSASSNVAELISISRRWVKMQ